MHLGIIKSGLKRIFLAILFLSSMVLFYNCSEGTLPELSYINPKILSANKLNFNLASLEFSELPYTIWRLADPANNPNPVDENGIEIFNIDGGTYYHALHMFQRIEWYVDSYYQSRDSLYLNWIRKYYEKELELAVEDRNAIYFQYNFNWPMHGNKNELMKAPWLSGLTQGVALMVFSRLSGFTGDSEYTAMARKTFNSFNMFVGEHEPWITMVDENNYLWIEEYPNETDPNFTLNGFIFCIYGLYEYWSVTKDPHAEFLIQASITTIKHYIEQFRVPGGISYYCLKHKFQYPGYHNIHIGQLKTLYAFTGDKYFEAMADSFYNDYHQ